MAKLTEESKSWDQGYMCALATLIRMHGESTPIEDAFRANYLSVSQMKTREIDDQDMEVLAPLARRMEREEKSYSK